MKSLLPALILVASLLGCNSMKVSVNHDETVDFSSYVTFAFSTDANEIRGTRASARAVASLIERTIRERLVAGDYAVAENDPDFIVAYHASVIDANASMPYGSGKYSAWGGGSSHVAFLSEGTLIIDIVDSDSNDLIWRGKASAVVERGSSEEANKVVRKAVRKMLAKFPPR